jgi:hypothetical protein
MQLLQLNKPIVAQGRAKPHVDEVGEACLGEESHIMLKGVVPSGRIVVEVERGHPDPLIG